ncbi:MAG: glycerate kinase [Caldilineaceae bacterium]|nr:glycerate kinase [Caldilineaceae bacterium]
MTGSGGSRFDLRVLDADPERRHTVLQVLEAALEAVDPARAVLHHVSLDGDQLRLADQTINLSAVDRILVTGAGKAGALMSQALEAVLGDRITAGLVVVKDGHRAPTEIIEICEARHPVPNQAGVTAGRRIIELLADTTERDLVINLLSGGGSALLVAPAEGLTLADLQAMTASLLGAGATINEINCLRKHCSQVKGGQLARSIHPARFATLAVSDVIGSPLDVIASGPTVPDSGDWQETRGIVEKFQLMPSLPPPIRARLEAGWRGELPDTPNADDPLFEGNPTLVVADNRMAMAAAETRARELGFNTVWMSSYVEGEASEVAKVLCGFGREVAGYSLPVPAPACLLFGGETTVTLSEDAGQGGRNQELALAAAFELADQPRTVLASLATDGTDGPTDSAGALVDAGSLQRGMAAGLNPRRHLTGHNAYPWLTAAGDMLVTGPTMTNVNDLMALFVFE